MVSTMAALIGMIPEGLYLLATVALTLSAMRLASRHILLHDMKSIETLARVNVLCVDKTGTITENKMAVQGVVPADGMDTDDVKCLIGDFAAAMSSDNITMEAIKNYLQIVPDGRR